MALFFKSSNTWIIIFRFDGRERVWLKAFSDRLSASKVHAKVLHELRDLYEDRAVLVEARIASEEEDLQYIRGGGPVNGYCRL